MGKKQVSETIFLGVLLAMSGGLMDTYSYLFREQVFANAQTGNILLFSVNLAQGNWQTSLRYLCPILAFATGIALAAVIRHLYREHPVMHWRQVCLLLESIILFSTAFMGQELNLLANSLISLACGAQVESFRKIEGSSVATTMCIGNLRLAIHSIVEYRFTSLKEEYKSAVVAATMIVSFAVGSVVGSVLIKAVGAYAIWASCLLLFISFYLMFSGKGERS